ncbi:TetR/AcrR family transcriptional regulator [Saccharothrix obliqua]|uniref:TetR/AcrR family transcriptional regulator n=1 Tax=Saccharothrix obliqua TaxID=2861747 RepID=UPI001C5E225F|nr:TetR/AcrR family transcriptional regulator [Saccharothrix obliqua]MBW4720215.1 TetR/AcrR family transcriptional regulator [Saccharothrix obliqua]
MAERKDAARNRVAILDAASRLIGERGLSAVCMEDVAVAAGVGKGTVFRRFGDREGLVQAVVAERTRAWREQSEALLADVASPPEERVVTFVGCLFDHVLAALPLIRALELVSDGSDGCADNLTPTRLATLIAQVRPDVDAEYLAHALLANLRGDVVHHLVHRLGLPADRVRAGVISLARCALTGDLEPAGRSATMPGL